MHSASAVLFCALTLEASRVVDVRSHVAVNLHALSHDDLQHLAACERVAEAVAEDQRQRQALAQLVRTSGRTRSLQTGGRSGGEGERR